MDIEECHSAAYHDFQAEDIPIIQNNLIDWFQKHRRYCNTHLFFAPLQIV